MAMLNDVTGETTFIHLRILTGYQGRKGLYMPMVLLKSQFVTSEVPKDAIEFSLNPTGDTTNAFIDGRT